MQFRVQNLTVHKFGGASVKDADAVRNVESILQKCLVSPAVVVVSAMGKTTNKLEQVFSTLVSDGFDKSLEELNEIVVAHQKVIDALSDLYCLPIEFDNGGTRITYYDQPSV